MALPAVATAADPTIVKLESIAPALRKTLEVQIRGAIRDGLAPAWIGARPGQVRVFERPDIKGPAYYEVEIRRQGTPVGYVLLASAMHDYPVPQWSATGPRHSEVLDRLATERKLAIGRILRFGIHLVAETASGELIAAWPPLTPALDLLSPEPGSKSRFEEDRGEKRVTSPDVWGQQRAELTAAMGRFAASKRDDVEIAWRNLLSDPSLDPGPPVCQVPDWLASPRYRQLQGNESPNNVWHASGCGPTAWALLIGWADRRAAQGDPRWAPYWQLLTEGGGADAFARNVVAGLVMDNNVEGLTAHLRARLGTWGADGQGVTEPWRMGRINDYLSDVNLGGGRLRTWSQTTHGVQELRLSLFAQNAICQGIPAVLGIGALEHYALATAWRARGGGEFYLNMGWAGWGNGWYHEGVYYIGGFEPGTGGTLPPMRMVSAATSQCLDVRDWRATDDAVVQQWGCAGTANQLWQARSDLSIIGLEKRCLAAPDLSGNTSGASHMTECKFAENEQGWRIGPAHLISSDGRCLTRGPEGNDQVSLAICARGEPEQRWHARSGARFENLSGDCLTNVEGQPRVRACGPLPVSAEQAWLIDPAGRLRSLVPPTGPNPVNAPGRCLVRFRIPLKGLPEEMSLRECTSSNAQKWRVQTALQRQSGGCLAIPGASGEMGTAAITEQCNGSLSQTWQLIFQ